ncbi:HAD family hydrolase [Actinocorallia sp. API 0066]|uniref:HAD family hydrolase n=1 Tax=Actinocorallia sp. API 0066 TaxID=2896846 RepID=UPI001E4EDFB6|nr:HAD family hydrolase [Actinocorallia sp. API 0066]MCD0451089.1 HAD family hydrolase [Actinocorallia sp. API 0066]
MTVAVCTDLDRTLIYSANALALEDVPHPPRLLCVELYQAKPLSYVTEEAAEELALLARRSLLVPTTTRTPEQYARVRLPGPPPRYAICANGGFLLVDGEEDPSWTARVRKRVADCAPVLDVHDRLRAMSGPFTKSVRVAADLFAYTVVDRASLPSGWLDDLTAWCAARSWTVSLQGRKVYALPIPLTKSAAARELATREPFTHLLAAGDSLLDADLLTLADAAIRPAHGELHTTPTPLPPTLTVTPAPGIRAGAAITSWLLSRALDPTRIPTTGPWRHP